MSGEQKPQSPEREQTDESLRAEREKVDDALRHKLAAVEETADAVISKARERADAVLAAARAKTDLQIRGSTAKAEATKSRARTLEDEALREERADADEAVRVERAQHGALLSAERVETDKDLFTERVRADDAVSTRDEFLGIVSHDLRNMLGSMIGFAAAIESAYSQDRHSAKVLAGAQRIQRSGARMSRLIGDLVDVASIEAGALAVTPEVGDPAHVALEAIENFQRQASSNGLSLLPDIAAPLPLVAFDPARILQVLTNLLSNAIKFTPPGGQIIVRVQHTTNSVHFAVSDSGIGMPAETLEAVFDRFHQISTTDRRGVGLGLYISRCIVQGHGGRIWVESKLGAGSTVHFTLPAAA